MKKALLLLTILSTLLLSSCSVFERGNYDKDRTGYVLNGDMLVSYHTNSIGELDVFMIDQVFSYFEALQYVSFDNTVLYDENEFSSVVTISELLSCGIESTINIPKFFRIDDKTFYYNIRENGYCTFDEYTFEIAEKVNGVFVYYLEDESPIVDLNITLFKNADFKVNTFESTVFIENVYFDSTENEWRKEIITALPLSIKQAGNMFEDNTSYIAEIAILERYVLENQSINLLKLKEDYQNVEVNNIWSEDTVDFLGRDHDVIKSVKTKKAGDILSIINDTLSRLGMFS